MKDFTKYISQIKNKEFAPIYFLYGDETFFIDEITAALQENVLTEEEKAFNQHIFYANEIDAEDVILQARQYPMMAERQLIIVKEAQAYDKQLNAFEAYFKNPVPSTILVINYKYKKPDGRTAYAKAVKANGLLLESNKLYENQIPEWIYNLLKQRKLKAQPNVIQLLAESIGDDLSRISNEVKKLAMVLNPGEELTPELVEKHIGISKDYNIFELTKAIGVKNKKKAYLIAHHFTQNPKDHNFVFYLGLIFSFFHKLMLYHALPDKSRTSVAKILGVSPFFVKEYEIAAQNYPLKKVTAIISLLRDTDMKSKGLGVGSNTTEKDLYNELLFKILH